MLAEKKHIHKVRVDHILVPNARKKSLLEDAVKDIQKHRQLICLLQNLSVDLLSAVWPQILLVSGGSIMMRSKTDWALETKIFNTKKFHERFSLNCQTPSIGHPRQGPFYISAKVNGGIELSHQISSKVLVESYDVDNVQLVAHFQSFAEIRYVLLQISNID